MIEPLNLMSMESLGEPDPTAITKQDLLSAIAFDRSGQILSVGDRGGRVICFQHQRNEQGVEEFEYLTEFQSHNKTFDVLSSHEVSETVTAIEWINAVPSAQPALLSSNSRCVKLFRLVNKQVYRAESIKKKMAKGQGLCLPKTKLMSESKESKHISTFKTGKEQHLNSLSLSSDLENFIAADENRINLWNLERPGENEVYNLVDYKRQRAAEDDELICSSRFSDHSSVFVYTTSKGYIRICDFRESSNFHKRPSIEFSLKQRKSFNRQNVFDQWLNVVSDASFVPNSDHYVLSRDYLSAKLWDTRMGTANTSSSNGMIVDSTCSAKPIYSAQVTDYLERNLSNQLENDALEDQFTLAISPDGKHFCTGGYNKSGHVIDMTATTNTSIMCKFDQKRDTPVGGLKVYGKNKKLVTGG